MKNKVDSIWNQSDEQMLADRITGDVSQDRQQGESCHS